MSRLSNFFLASAFLFLSSSLSAEVDYAGDGGFSVSNAAQTQEDAATVYQAMVRDISKWWNGDHSWSGDAANLYFDARLGGCFCERLPGGGVEHLHIIYLAPEKEIRFHGGLGPLQQLAVQGVMTWKLSPLEKGTEVSFVYTVHGHLPEGGFEGLAPAVDGVVSEQLDGLIALLNQAGKRGQSKGLE